MPRTLGFDMAALKGLALAMELAEHQRVLAGMNLVQIQGAFGSARNQLHQLESYLLDSEARWLASSQSQMDPGLLQDHYKFIGRLRHAIGLQSGVLSDIKLHLDEAKKSFLAAELRLNSLQCMMKKRTEIGNKNIARREQKFTDEFASQQHVRAVAQNQGRGLYGY